LTLSAQAVTILNMTTATGFPANGGRVPADTLAHRLQLLRDELGWSQRRAAQECGLGFGEWQSMENGARARGLDEKVARIAGRTGYDPVWLMWGGPLHRATTTTTEAASDETQLPHLDSNQKPTVCSRPIPGRRRKFKAGATPIGLKQAA
jgi:transcriptional regulator with XRE-family HTH domain